MKSARNLKKIHVHNISSVSRTLDVSGVRISGRTRVEAIIDNLLESLNL